MKKKRVRHHVNPLADRTEHRFVGFDNDRSIIVDIGADRGEFTYGLLERYGATRNFIVCEIRKPLARRLYERFHAYDNVVVFDGDAVRNFAGIVQPSVERGVTVEEIYINFPDPWFKERHKKRRVITSEFLQSVRGWISPETVWIFQTDQKQLFDETVIVVHNIGGTVIELCASPPHGITTKWENAKVANGQPIYRMCFNINK